MRITRVTTRAGDEGSTRLAGGQLVSKAELRMEAVGSVDELSAALGLARALAGGASRAESLDPGLDPLLSELQQDLFAVAAELATLPADRWPGMPLLDDRAVTRLERHLADQQEGLPPLQEFLVPGACAPSAALHLARTVCRRAERATVRLAAEPGALAQDSALLRYLNRLGDLLFAAARRVARRDGAEEQTWKR